MVSGQAAAKSNEDGLGAVGGPTGMEWTMASWQLRGGPKIQKPGLFLEVDNFATLGGRNACVCHNLPNFIQKKTIQA